MAAHKGAPLSSGTTAQRLYGGLDDGMGSEEVDDGVGSRENQREILQPDGVSESLR
jgi:hypothetical protein